jgi:hypothetical protein
LLLRKFQFLFYNFIHRKPRVYQIINFSSYEDYLSLQKSKTLDPVRRKLWLNEGWGSKVIIFYEYFKKLFETHILNRNCSSSALCVGARTGQEVDALRKLKLEAIGIDLVPNLPHVIIGDFHQIPIESN